MKVLKEKNQVLLYLGLICLLWWFIDLYNILILIQKPSWLLWYSSSGLLLTSIALITGNEMLISVLFCALFVVESIWNIDFFYHIIFSKPLIGFTNYAFAPSFEKKDFYLSFYHLLIPTGLFLAFWKKRIVNSHAWIGATLYSTTLLFLTYFFVDKKENVNCIFHLAYCNMNFAFIQFPLPWRIFIGVGFLLIFIFVPTQLIMQTITSHRSK